MARSNKKRYAIIAGIGAVALTAGAAFAYWTTTGTGNASAATANPVTADWTVAVTNTSVNALYPSNVQAAGTSNKFTYTVTNNSTGSLGLNGLSITLTVTPVGANVCAAGNYEIWGGGDANTSTIGGSGPSETVTYTPPVNADAGALATSGSFEVRLVNDPANSQDGCKGATVKATANAS